MTALDERIERFEHMASADPENDMAHFSLGSAYLQAERPADAAASLERCLALNPGMSKAWQLAGQAYVDAGEEAKAVETLNRGYTVAAERGDLLPRDAMADLLRSVGHEPPQVSAEVEEAARKLRESGAFVCTHSGRPGTEMTEVPLPGEIGRWIMANISTESWREWIGQGTKVINELRLDFSKDEDQATFEQHMVDFFSVPAEVVAADAPA
ncbi:MAG: Fe(2+)-trafficking protein [Phycisphaerales bacterium]